MPSPTALLICFKNSGAGSDLWCADVCLFYLAMDAAALYSYDVFHLLYLRWISTDHQPIGAG